MSGTEADRGGLADQLPAPEELVGYEVLDPQYQRIGSAQELLVSKDSRPRYVRVRLDPLGLRSVLIPVEAVWIDQKRRILVLQKTAERVEQTGESGRDGRRG